MAHRYRYRVDVLLGVYTDNERFYAKRTAINTLVLCYTSISAH